MKTIPYPYTLTEKQKANLLVSLEALRSGEYKQIFYKLVGDQKDCYCAQGVMAVCQGLPLAYDQRGIVFPGSIRYGALDQKWMSKTYGFDYDTYLTKDISADKWTITGLNDIKKLSFSVIADVLESCFINCEEIEI